MKGRKSFRKIVIVLKKKKSKTFLQSSDFIPTKTSVLIFLSLKPL